MSVGESSNTYGGNEKCVTKILGGPFEGKIPLGNCKYIYGRIILKR